MVEDSPPPPSPEELGVVVDIESAVCAVGFLSALVVVSPVVVAAALAVVVVVVVVVESCDKLVMSPSNYQTKFYNVNNFRLFKTEHLYFFLFGVKYKWIYKLSSI